MLTRARSYLLATLLLLGIAFTPVLINAFGYYRIGISGCFVPTYEPKPRVYCSVAVPPGDSMTEKEANLTQLIDYGVMLLLTFPLAGGPAILTALLCLYFGAKELLKKRKNDLAKG